MILVKSPQERRPGNRLFGTGDQPDPIPGKYELLFFVLFLGELFDISLQFF